MFYVGDVVVFLVCTAMRDGLADELYCQLFIVAGLTADSKVVCYVSVSAESVNEGFRLCDFAR